MPGFLKQSTASQSRALGPFISDSDFKTVQTGLTIANTDIKLVVNGAASANKNSGGGTHRVNGVYGVTFDATDTATVGEMEVSVSVSGALVVFDKFFVIEEAVYDALFAASAAGYQLPIWSSAGATVNLSGTTVAAVSGSVGSVTGAVGSVTSPVTVGTNNDKTGYTLSATGSAAMTEGYRANGGAGTLNQLLYEVIAHLGESAISGTTKTIKKIDHSTTAEVFTLDDATNPSSITRAS